MDSLFTNKVCPNCGGLLKATDNTITPFICNNCKETFTEVDESEMELCLIIPMFVSLRHVAEVKLNENLFDIQVDSNCIAVISNIKMNTCELIRDLKYSYLKC